jgi:hypothetical protein
MGSPILKQAAVPGDKPPYRIFISYSRNDSALAEEFYEQLEVRVRNDDVPFQPEQIFFDRADIQPGEDWERKCQSALDQSQVVILLVSVHCFKNRCCWELEIPRAAAAEKPIIPVILSECSWEKMTIGEGKNKRRLGSLSALPQVLANGKRSLVPVTDGKPDRHERDVRWKDIVNRIVDTCCNLSRSIAESVTQQRPSQPPPLAGPVAGEVAATTGQPQPSADRNPPRIAESVTQQRPSQPLPLAGPVAGEVAATIGQSQPSVDRNPPRMDQDSGMASDQVPSEDLHQANADPLAYRLPERLRRLLYHRASPAFGMRSVWVVVALCLCLGLLASPFLSPRWRIQNLTLEGHSNDVTSVAFSPDGTRLASGSHDYTVKLWNVATGKAIASFEGHSATVTSVAFSPNGTRLASGSWDNTIGFWDIPPGRELATFQGHSGTVTSVAFSPDGTRLASGSGDNTAKLWDLVTGQKLTTFEGRSGTVTSVAFSPDGIHIASGSGNNTAMLWDVATAKAMATFRGHSGPVTSVAFSPDSSRLASGSRDSTVKLWDVKTGWEFATVRGHSGPVTSVAFSPDGTHLASGSEDNTVKVWTVPSGTWLFLGHQ